MQLIEVNYPVRKSPNMELQLDKILCPASTNSCKYAWFLHTGLKKIQ